MGKTEFIKICRDRKFWKWVRNNSPKTYPSVPDKDSFLIGLYKRIRNRTYYPNPPLEYITLNKGSGVLRIIPVLTLEDLCVYYFCARKLEKYIAYNRTPGTYGGFGLSGKLRKIEEQETCKSRDRFEVIEIEGKEYVFTEIDGSTNLTSLNPKAWFAEWNDFTNKLYFNCAEYQEGFVAELDISNFYDSIQIDNLEYKLRKTVPHTCNDILYLVTHFLRFWNRHINFYRQQGAGIPQDTFGECSRILANFYLQAYDKKVSDFCLSKKASFFRYADDQIIFAKSKEDLTEIIAKASSFAMREGLNFNQKKIKIMNLRDFKKYYSFENFFALAAKDLTNLDPNIIERQIKFYLKNKKSLKKGGMSLLRRIISVLSKSKKQPAAFKELKNHLLFDFLPNNHALSVSDLSQIYTLLNKTDKIKMLKILENDIEQSWYTAHLYQLKLFYKLNRIPYKKISHRITYLKRFYNFEKTT